MSNAGVPIYPTLPRCDMLHDNESITAHWDLNGNCFQLRQMIQIMACDGFNEFAERHLPALRMEELLGHSLRRHRTQQHEVPLAHAGEGHHSCLCIVAGVIPRPQLLVEGLDDVMIFRESLAQSIAEDYFAIRKVAQDFEWAPFSWSWRFFDSCRTERNGKLFKMPGGSGHHFEGIASA